LNRDLRDHEEAQIAYERRQAAARRRIAEREALREQRRRDTRRRAMVFLAALLTGVALILLLAPASAAEPEEPDSSIPAAADAVVQATEELAQHPAPLLPEQEAGRYGAITEEERELLARLVWLEARGESMDGQQAVAEVVLNRVAADNFPDTVEEVIFQGLGTKSQQFSPAGRIGEAEPGADQYEAVEQALLGESILPMDVVYFSRGGENDRVWGRIGGHVFCHQYIWE